MTRSPRELANQKIQIRKQQEALLRDLLSVLDALDRAAEHWQQAERNHLPQNLPLPDAAAPLELSNPDLPNPDSPDAAAPLELSNPDLPNPDSSDPSDSKKLSPPSFSWWYRWRQRLGIIKITPPVLSAVRETETAELTQTTAATDDTETDTETLGAVVTSAREGIDMIRESMLNVLRQHQIVPLPAEGHPFDPSEMYALGQKVDVSVAPNTVVQEILRGYRWQDRILREAQVIVAVPPAEDN